MIRAFPPLSRTARDPGPAGENGSLLPQKNRLYSSALTFLAIFVLVLTLSQSVRAMEPVSGHYRSSFGTTIELDLQIGYPPPASLIIEQYFPPYLQIISAQPALRKYSSTRGIAKWLLKGIKPGSYTISLQFDQPVQSSVIRAVIRYRFPLRGYFVEYRIVP